MSDRKKVILKRKLEENIKASHNSVICNNAKLHLALMPLGKKKVIFFFPAHKIIICSSFCIKRAILSRLYLREKEEKELSMDETELRPFKRANL